MQSIPSQLVLWPHNASAYNVSTTVCAGRHSSRHDQQTPGIIRVMCSTKQTQALQAQIGQQQPCRPHIQYSKLGKHCSSLNPAGPFTSAAVCRQHHSAWPTCLPAAVRAVSVATAVAKSPQDTCQPKQSTARQKRRRKPPPQPAVVAQPHGASSSMGTSYPRLTPYPTAVDSSQILLCEVLHISPAEAQLLLLNSEGIATLNRQQLTANWGKLQQLLPVSKVQLLQAMLQLPELLVQPQGVVNARLAEAADVLQIPLQQLRRPYVTGRNVTLVPQLYFQLLVLSKQQLRDKLLQLKEVLGLDQQQQQQQQQERKLNGQQLQKQQQRLLRQQNLVVSLALREPKLLSIEQPQLLSSVEALEELCACPIVHLLPGVQSEARLLVTPAEQLYAAAADLQQLLQLSEQGLAPVIRGTPGALLVPARQVSALLDQLAGGLGVPVEVAADILLQEPAVLLRRPGAVSAVLGVLRSTFKLKHEQLLQVVEFDPSVLCCSPGALADSTSKFKEAALKHRAWAVEYRHLMSLPVNVARALRIEPLRLLRLTYLYRMRQAARISLKAAVSMSGRQFVNLYPGYQDWLAKHYSAGGVPSTYRLHYQGEDSDEDEE